MEHRVNGHTIRLIKGNITDQEADAVVNAANPSLMGGGGVDGAIHRRGGPSILEECREIRRSRHPHGLPTSEAVITTGGDLRARHVIHTVGPIWRGGSEGEPQLLARAYANTLKLAASHDLRTIAFPSISTGAYGYPIDSAATVALKTARDFLRESLLPETVVFVLYSESDLETYIRKAEQILGLNHRPTDSPRA
jgi:O-acetyl-ADP-ribose deacetylase (regulator of RNase III)